MTSQGSAYARFQRALVTGNPLIVTAACAELPRVGLVEALEVCLVYRDAAPDRFGRVIARWHSRYVAEQRADEAEAAFVLSCLRALAVPICAGAAADALVALFEQRGLQQASRAVERWADRAAGTA